MFQAVCFLGALAVVAGFPSSAENASSFRTGSVYCKGLECKFVAGTLDYDKATAVAAFNDTLLTKGWGFLDVKAGYASRTREADRSPGDVTMAAGFAEGMLTAHQINNQLTNFLSIWFEPGQSAEKLKVWLQKQEDWVNGMVKEHADDPFWQHISLLDHWVRGMWEGYKLARQNDPSLPQREWYEFRILQASGSVGDLIDIAEGRRRDWLNMDKEKAEQLMLENSRCSALIKILPGFEDVFMSHSTWFRYESTARIFKTYDINTGLEGTANPKVSFSSYGGNLGSLDDFYMIGGKLLMLQTTNGVFNSSLFDLVTPESLLTWQRVLVANWMARGGQEWGRLVARHNSGTYNNQYMLLDLGKIQPGRPLPDDTLWVTEQIPGLVESRDLTAILRKGYYPSYNIPIFENVYNISGYPDMVKKHGYTMSYDLAPRAKIFRRDHSKVTSLEDMKKLMRYNDYHHDPYSDNDPTHAICARGDLKNPRPVGCYDTKVTSLALARQNRADIIGGPTLGTGLKPFSWTGPFNAFSHQGLPETYDFPFMSYKPRFDAR